MNLPASELEGGPATARPATMKFTYASGSRPLEGYTIKRGVGRGGFGEVYFATSDAGKEVALKLIRRNLEVELRGVTQCLNLKHPNLIALYDIRTDDMGDQWVVMEYVAGESLEDAIERNPDGMPVEEVLWWMRGVCAGVAYLHDHGIVHRDLKPGNIFCDEGTVKIGDYGLAKFISCSRRSGQTESVGTVHYMAPEIANGRYGREIDTYALGIILFEMLTGRVPFEGESVGEVLMKHLTAEPDLSALEEPYGDIVRRALAKDPNVRIDSVGEMLALLPGGGELPRFGHASPRHYVNDIDAQLEREARRAEEELGAELREVEANLHYEFAGHSAPRDAEKQARHSAQASEDAVEEPIWQAIRSGIDYLRRRWNGDGVPQMPLYQKVLFAVAVILFVIWFANGAVYRSAVQALMVYAIYYVVWISFIRPNVRPHPQPRAARGGGPVTAAAAQPANQQTVAWPTQESAAASATEQKIRAQMRRRVRASWRDKAYRELAAKPLRDKLSELLGSMLLAAAFAAVASCVVLLLSAQQPASDQVAVYLWLATVGTLGSWAVLVPAKLTEGRLEDQAPMRLMMVVAGGLVGVAAWALGDALLVKPPRAWEPIDAGWSLIAHEMLGWPQPPRGSNLQSHSDFMPSFSMYVSYFAFLFLLVRWWRQSEFTRTARLSVWSILACMIGAWLVHLFWWFPQPTGILVAGVIALSTQLASPWMPPSRRRALAAEIEEGLV